MKKENSTSNEPPQLDKKIYQKKYWQLYKETRQRVHGILDADEYQKIKARADENNCSVWQQIYAQAQAYENNAPLDSSEIKKQRDEIIFLLRDIASKWQMMEVKAGEDGHGLSNYGQHILERLQQIENLIKNNNTEK